MVLQEEWSMSRGNPYLYIYIESPILHSRSESNLSWETNAGWTIQEVDSLIPG